MAALRHHARVLLATAGLCLLSACVAPGVPMGVTALSEARAEISANGIPLRVVPPQGFCIATESVQAGPESVFVLMGGCRGEAGPVLAAYLTVTVSFAPLFAASEDRDDALDRLEAFLGTATGLALAGRGGPTERLKLLESYREQDALLLFVEDTGTQVIPSSGPRFWRAFLDLRGRMVSVSVSTFVDRPAGDRDMLALLRTTLEGLRGANPALPPSDIVTPVAPLLPAPDATTPAAEPPPDLRG